jgi:hypothetical protein
MVHLPLEKRNLGSRHLEEKEQSSPSCSEQKAWISGPWEKQILDLQFWGKRSWKRDPGVPPLEETGPGFGAFQGLNRFSMVHGHLGKIFCFSNSHEKQVLVH